MRRLSERKLLGWFNNFLDDLYGQVKVGDGVYPTSFVLSRVDKAIYRESYLKWLHARLKDGTIKKIGDVYYTYLFEE